tara:strand:+ start:506 stop:754 length:249 start_codon:yes stop_codon:yes gene_type:complete
MKTTEEINEMIKKLEKSKLGIPEISMFGDHNHQAIDLAIEVLEENLDEDDVYYKELEGNVENMGITAVQWANGEADDEELID